ncbi:MAG: hypothetical protein FWC41_12015 [Firmicutes bacterium]|nr:hypothetical protein [Bacillota bacterium]
MTEQEYREMYLLEKYKENRRTIKSSQDKDDNRELKVNRICAINNEVYYK